LSGQSVSVEVAVGVLTDLLGGAAGVPRQDLVEHRLHPGDLLRLQDQVRDRAACLGGGLAQDTRPCGRIVRFPASPPASSTAAVQAALSTHVGLDRRSHELHRVVDGEDEPVRPFDSSRRSCEATTSR
jgi:hypothetical protein